MFLQELRRLSERPEVAGDLTPEGYSRRRVRYVVRLDPAGNFLGLIDQGQEGPKASAGRGRLQNVPDRIRPGISPTPLLLSDGPDYVFGISSEPEKEKRTRRRREAFMDLVHKCAEATGVPEVRAVERYLEGRPRPADLDPEADLVTFEVGGIPVVDLPAVRQFWVHHLQPLPDGVQLECLVCGRVGPVARVWPVPIKGIPGGQTSGNQLASANVNAFESYGLEGSSTSPACRDCATAAGKALNWLIHHDAHHLRTPTSVFVFWARSSETFDFARLLSQPEPDEVGELLKAPHTGKRGAVAGIEADRFFLAELGASGSRVVLRGWFTSTLDDVRSSLVDYFKSQDIVQFDGSGHVPISVNSLALATAREWKDVHPETVHDLVMAAFSGRSLPPRMLAAAQRRVRSEQRFKITHPRAALMKMALVDSKEGKEEFMKQLDDGNTEPAYVCGRLLAELEAVQRVALGNPKATLTDRFFGAASSAPATVFGPLIRNAQHHLAKLRKDRPGAFVAIDGRITDILVKLDKYPATFSLKEQAMFGLGYYHQRAADRAAARAAKARGRMEQAELAEDTEAEDSKEGSEK